MSIYRQVSSAVASLVLKTASKPQITSSRSIKRWVAPTLKELYRRRQKLGPEPPKPRSSFLEWNYEAEVFALGKRVSEEFDRDLLKQALTHRSYVVSQEEKAKENGSEFSSPLSNNGLVSEGNSIISGRIREQFSKKYPDDVVAAIQEHLTSDEMLAHVTSHMGLKDIVLTAEFPVENSTLANTFKAIIAALKQSQDLDKANRFIDDFLICQLKGKDIISEIWTPEKPLEYLQGLLKQRGIQDEIEPRLCNQSAVNTILANYQVGLYDKQRQLLGIGWGESIEIAKDTAALDAIERIHEGKLNI